MTAPGPRHDHQLSRAVAAARSAGWRTRTEVTGALWRADLVCYRDGAAVAVEVEAHRPTDHLPVRHYERLHAGAWCFWFADGARSRFDFPVYPTAEIEERLSSILVGRVPALDPASAPIERNQATVDSATIITCRVCTFPRRLIGLCWRCGFGGGPYHPPVAEEGVRARRQDFTSKYLRLRRTPVEGIFASMLTWRSTRRLQGTERHLVAAASKHEAALGMAAQFRGTR
jgi:hypothetical protein